MILKKGLKENQNNSVEHARMQLGNHSFKFPVEVKGRYLVLKNVDEGGFGLVNECLDKVLRRKFVIKIVRVFLLN
jgi:hypothetical protein